MLQAARAIALATLALVPLFVWPGGRQPFVTPRLLLLGISDTALAVLVLLARVERPRWPPALAWSTAALVAAFAASSAFSPHVSLEAIAIVLLPLAWAWLLAGTHLGIRRITGTLVVAGTLLSAWTLAQAAGFDLLRAAGWRPAVDYGPRMRMYGSLGNPNFVGAVLAALLPLALVRARRQRGRERSLVVVVLHVAALAATGSRGAWLGAAAGLAVLAWTWRRPAKHMILWAALLLAAGGLAIAFGSTRPISTTIRGRLYIWSVAAPHAVDRPLFGYGPGAVAVQYPRWEADRLRQGVDEDVRRYAAPQRHLHNDYLEALIDLGVPGTVAWVCVIAVAVAGGLRARGDSVHDIVGSGAGVAALAVVALVDFPFARPVELFVFWTLAACTAAGSHS
jgi:O-antigen ligase